MIQIIIVCILVLLGIYCFKFYPLERRNTKKLAFSALIIIITLILKRLTIMVPLFGAESLKIGFEYIPVMLAGVILSPSYAYLIGLITDLLGLVISPTGFPFFGFTLNQVLIGLIPSLIAVKVKNVDGKRFSKIVCLMIALFGGAGSLFVALQKTISIGKVTYTLTSLQKGVMIGLCLIASIGFILFMLKRTKNMKDNDASLFGTWLLSVILVELAITFCLTPFWLQIMYGIPFVVSVSIRVIKACFIIPLEIIIGFPLLKQMDKLYK